MKICVAVLAMAMLAAAGCGPSTGYLIRPVSVNEALEETTVSRDPGFLIADKIVVVELEGLLMNYRSEGLLGARENPLAAFVEKLDKAEKDPEVKALVLRINSPGGGVTASDLMYRRLIEFKANRKVPVVAVIEDVGASGAYFIASGADTIIVAPTSVTGSIGVIVQMFSVAGTLEKLGITAKAITSGPMKDMGSPFKPLNEADQKVLQAIVSEFYERFIDVVAAGRPALSRDAIKKLADGRVYTGMQAVENGLANSTGDVKSAVAEAKKRANLKTAKVVMYDRPWGYKANVYSTAPVGGMSLSLGTFSSADVAAWLEPQFLYLWAGGGGR
jgi:protease-4